MACPKCGAENPSKFHSCSACGQALFLASLKEISERHAVSTYYIYDTGATLGRHFDNNIALLDYSVSRHHARIDCRKGKFFIQDLSSSNGVAVNDVQVRRKELKDFDRLTLGNVMMLFRTTGHGEVPVEPCYHTQQKFIAAIKDISQVAKSAALSHQALEIAADFATSLTGAERAIIFLYDREAKLQPASLHNFSEHDLGIEEFDVSITAIREAESRRQMIIHENMLGDPHYHASQSVHDLKLHTIICLPLKSPRDMDLATASPNLARGRFRKDDLFGLLYLDSRRPLKGMPEHRKDMLQVLADQTSLAIENALLQQELDAQQDLKDQISAAKDVQQKLFPKPEYVHVKFDMAFAFEPAQQVGGDYLCFLPLSESRFLIAIGDVVGKGLPAGLVVMTLHGGLYSELSHEQNVLNLMRSLDRLIYEYSLGKVFVTFFAGILDVERMTFEYASAGHNPPLWYAARQHEWRELRAAGPPLGVNLNAARSLRTVDLAPGDYLAFYTDGMTEMRNDKLKQLGNAGLQRLLSSMIETDKRNPMSLTDLLHAVMDQSRHFVNFLPWEDDTSLMMLRMK